MNILLSDAEKPNFDPDLPWKEKPMKVNSVIDVHVSMKHVIEKIKRFLYGIYYWADEIISLSIISFKIKPPALD